MLKGALAASVTPLAEHGSALDEDAFSPLVEFFVGAGLDGILALGTAGEGILLRPEERRRVADLFLQASDRRLQVAVHCGAQTTADTVALSMHAAEVGADAGVVIGPEALIAEGMAHGAIGAVSALASAVPSMVTAVVRDPTPEGAAHLAELRAFVERFPRQAALKRLLGLQGVPVREDVRAHLRGLTVEERDELDAWAERALA